MSVTFPKVKAGDRVRLTGTGWNREDHGVEAGDIVTVVEERCDYGAYKGAPQFEDTVNGGYFVIYDDWEDEDGSWGGEVVEDADAVNPSYYQFPNGAEVRFISEWLTANAAQAFQYIARSSRIDGQNKGDAVEDIRKAIKFLEFEIERLESKK